MKKIYSYCSLALLAGLSLSSCSRSDYTFKPGTGSYHTAQSATVVSAPIANTEVVAAAIQPTAVAIAKVAATPLTPAPAQPAAVAKSAKPTKLAGVQKAVATKLAKKLQARHTEAAQADQVQSKAGRAGLIMGIGLVILLIGGLIGGTNFVATIGGVVFLVGLVMLIIALISS